VPASHYGEPMLLVCVFDVPDGDRAAFTGRARRAAELLGCQPGCRGVSVGRAVDAPQRWVLTARFDSVTAYRRCLAPFAVREHVVPLLAQCLDGVPSTYEVLLDSVDGTVAEASSLLADDASTVRRGGAATASRGGAATAESARGDR